MVVVFLLNIFSYLIDQTNNQQISSKESLESSYLSFNILDYIVCYKWLIPITSTSSNTEYFQSVSCLMCRPPLQLYLKCCPPFYTAFDRAQGQHWTQKKPRSLLEISGECRTWPANEDTAALVWELRVSQERRVMRPLTHDSVCLVSDTERQPTREMGTERERKKREEGVRTEGPGKRLIGR